ncbi:MAG: hypothetical protein AAF577_02205 [Pseudomonadota bacterium]
MLARIVIVLIFATAIAGFTSLAFLGVWGESTSVVSARAGSPGGGYGVGGRVK